MSTRTIEWTVGDEPFEGYLAEPDGEARGAVLICHAWAGRGAHEEAVARKLAGLGYRALAGDVYGRGVRGGSKEENQALMEPLVSDRTGTLQARLTAGLDALRALGPDPVVVSGYCFGGLCALDVARANLGVSGAAAFHAILGEDGAPDGGDIDARVIAFQGFDDPMATPDDLTAFGREMTRRSADWRLHVFGGVMHAFTNEDANDPDFGTVYDAEADARSWSSFVTFLDETLRG